MAWARRRSEWRPFAYLLQKIDAAWFKRARPTTVADFDPFATAEERRPRGKATLADLSAAFGLPIKRAD